MKREKYIAPILEMELVNTQEGIAAGSALVTGGTVNGQYNPDIESYGAELPGGSY
ncbi:hypothetical protein [Sphingobacterium sp. UBA7038]|uniref:hypothetical protein n=1 Tax=Sphingobacterium TaxID=28453 RepID=UPI00257BDE13|nr:hypothetical protein [Sphingobacterium sp. UBA7038]